MARIDIQIDTDSLMILLEGNPESDHEYPAVFTMTRGSIVKTAGTVGFRLRGNTSRYSGKKSFKVSVNSYEKGKDFYGVEKINLNGEHNDPSVSRARICWDLFQKAGVPCPRSNHVELYINGEYKGIYLNVEHIDEEFAESRFENKNGNLYKCLWPADLAFLGSDPELYKYYIGARRAYELKTNENEDDYKDLCNFITILNQTPPEEFPGTLEKIFNINSYLKNLVVEVLAGHWDAYSYNKNNFYLYHNQITGKFEFIPYDTDNTFGIDWFGINWAERNIYEWGHPFENRPLYEQILQNELYRERYSFYMDRFLTEHFSVLSLEQEIYKIRDQIRPFAENDIYRTLDYGFSREDFTSAFDEAFGRHVSFGILPYIQTRSSTALLQLVKSNVDPIINNHTVTRIPEDGDIQISVNVENERQEEIDVRIHMSTGGEFQEFTMTSIGNEMFDYQIDIESDNEVITYYFTAVDELMQASREPFEGYFSFDPGSYNTNEIKQMPIFTVFPNPFHKDLTISLASGQYVPAVFTIYNVSGQVVESGLISEAEFQIPIAPQKYSPGMYFMEIKTLSKPDKNAYYEHFKLFYTNP